MINKKIGRYEIKELIGEGAMSKVYRAYDPDIDRSLAFKVLKDDFCVDEEYLYRFLRESKAAGALSHANIVTVYDVGKIEKSPYIMMELLEGRDLGEILKEKKKIPLKDTLIFATQLARALDYAHQEGVVHRDIKPDNIIIMPDGKSIKVADFGIARMDESEDAQKTLVGSVLGTPRYMSPEQALGEEVDGRSDLFSVGVILYEMISGVKAFDAKNIGTLMIQIAQKQPASLAKLCPELPSGLRQIIEKLLNKKPAKRFQSGGQLAKALIRELVAIREQEEEQIKDKYIPLKVRWAISMGAIVAVVLLISMSVVFNIQSRSMIEQAVDSGTLFTKFIATEIAADILTEDWIVIDSIINGDSNKETFKYLTVTDHNNVIQVASDKTLLGQIYKPDDKAELISDRDGVNTSSLELIDNSKVFIFSAPILWQNTKVGNIILGLSQDSVDNVKSVTGWLMVSLAVITISSVVLMLFIFGAMLAKPFKLIVHSLKSFGEGNYDMRISTRRNDELGELFQAFDKMATAVEKIIAGKTGSDAKNNPESDDSDYQKIAKKPAKKGNNKKNIVKTKKYHETDIIDDATIIVSSNIDNNNYDSTIPASDETIIATTGKVSGDSDK